MAVATETQVDRVNRYRVSAREYATFHGQGFLTLRRLLSPEEIAELRDHTEDLMQGRLPEGYDVPAGLSPQETTQFVLKPRAMLHRTLELHERYLLHSRVLDVVEALIGPDVLAVQTMLFIKAPGSAGQGWHQDAYWIPTHPDSLCGAWIAIDDADEVNGALWMAAGSQHEPVYPPKSGYGYGHKVLDGIEHITGSGNPDDEQNDLTKIADRYPQVLASAKAGDVVFIGSRALHRSKRNFSADRYRRAFVSHYCNARSFTQYGTDFDSSAIHAAPTIDPVTRMTNASHILARGDTHLPFAIPRFGTPCAALLSAEERRRESEYVGTMMGDMGSGMMDAADADPTLVDDDE
jgi:ectoine hydroxylase-related dioxygenase (phytanoyl-CoA dioxygenase family)